MFRRWLGVLVLLGGAAGLGWMVWQGTREPEAIRLSRGPRTVARVSPSPTPPVAPRRPAPSSPPASGAARGRTPRPTGGTGEEVTPYQKSQARLHLQRLLEGLPRDPRASLLAAADQIGGAAHRRAYYRLAALDILRGPPRPPALFWMLLVTALGTHPEARPELLELYGQESDSQRKAFLAAAMAQIAHPSPFSSTYGIDHPARFPKRDGGPEDLAWLLPRLVVSGKLPEPVRQALVKDLTATSDPVLAGGLAHALRLAMVEDGAVRELLLSRAGEPGHEALAIQVASELALAAARERGRADLLHDALEFLRRGSESEQRAVALRLALTADPALRAEMVEHLTSERAPEAVRIALLGGLAGVRPRADEPAGRAILDLVEQSGQRRLRLRAIGALVQLTGWTQGEQEELLHRVLADGDPLARAEGVRVVEGLKLTALADTLAGMAQVDVHPLVRLEARRVANRLGR